MLWGPVRPARARLQPDGFIRPCQPYLADRPPAGPDWLHEIKWDGYRLIARKGERSRMWARTGTDYSASFPLIRAALEALPAESALIDGEAVVVGGDGHSQFNALRAKQGQARAILIAFDLLEVDGEDLRREPLEARRARLKRLLKPSKGCAGAAIGAGLALSEALETSGAAVFDHACRLGVEGIVSKRRGSRYASGRTRAWLKIKNPNFERR
jgi:bifunctional non-homologous end joining protein LigD